MNVKITRIISLLLYSAVFVAACNNEAEEEVAIGGSSGTVNEISFPAPSFVAIDQNGEEFSSESLKGQPWIASFFFTSCQTVCPRLNDVQRGLQDEFSEMKFVSISTDPQTDDVAALRAYASEYGAIDGTWWMVRLPQEEMRSVASEGFKLIDPEDPAMHSTRFVAVDADMSIAGFFDSEDANEVEKLKAWMRSQQ